VECRCYATSQRKNETPAKPRFHRAFQQNQRGIWSRIGTRSISFHFPKTPWHTEIVQIDKPKRNLVQIRTNDVSTFKLRGWGGCEH
jgi:hypothetical protein